MTSVIMLSVTIESIMMNVIMLSVAMLNVVAPSIRYILFPSKPFKSLFHILSVILNNLKVRLH
jgi:hypothetical protein